jgi:hypothetical protein
MLNLNYNIIGAAKEGFVFPNSASLNYVFTSSVMALGLETNSELTMEVTSSQAPTRREFQTNGMINGIPFKQRTVKARPSSQVNVYYEGIGAWDTTNVPSGSTFPIVEYILVGGGAAGNRTDGGTGGGGGQGGIIVTGSFQIPFTQYQATMSLSIPQIGYNSTSASYSAFNAVTRSFFTASFTASANTKYDILATSSINPFVYKVKVQQIGAGGIAAASVVNPGSNDDYTTGADRTGSYQCTYVSFLSLDNANVSSSISTWGEGNPAPGPGGGIVPPFGNITGSGILYASGAIVGNTGGEGLTWLNNQVYGSGGGAGSGPGVFTNGGTNAGQGGSNPGPANFGGGGGGSNFTAGAGALGGAGGSGVAIFRFFDPSGSYVSTGGIRTVTGSYVYHTFITGSQEFNITVPAAIPY